MLQRGSRWCRAMHGQAKGVLTVPSVSSGSIWSAGGRGSVVLKAGHLQQHHRFVHQLFSPASTGLMLPQPSAAQELSSCTAPDVASMYACLTRKVETGVAGLGASIKLDI